MDNEKKIETRLNDLVKEAGGTSLKLLPFNVGGLPDRICLFPGGRMFFAELKSPGAKTSRLQKYWIAKLRKLGFEVYVIDASDHIPLIVEIAPKVKKSAIFKEITCAQCSKKHTKRQLWITGKLTFCSAKCRNDYYNELTRKC